MKIAVLWVVATCSLVEVDRRFGGEYCFPYQPVYTTTLNDAIFHKAVIFMIAAMITHKLYRLINVFLLSALQYVNYLRSKKMAAFYDMAPCTLVEVDRRFRSA
jgi:hypothetical protein